MIIIYGELVWPGEVTAMASSKVIFWLLYSHEGNTETHGILQSKYLAPHPRLKLDAS
jgi:hypothetical protein